MSHLTDRMPDVLHGRDNWTDADRLHLQSCAECAGEWRVVGSVQVHALEAIDTDLLAQSVLHRLGEEPMALPLRSRAAWRLGLVGLAAAASVALVVMLRSPSWSTEVGSARQSEPTMLPELDALEDAELELVLAYIAPVSDESLGTIPRVGDLTDEELELLLAEVEG